MGSVGPGEREGGVAPFGQSIRRSLPPTLTDMLRAERILIALAVFNLAILGLELAYSVVTALLGLP